LSHGKPTDSSAESRPQASEANSFSEFALEKQVPADHMLRSIERFDLPDAILFRFYRTIAMLFLSMF
jgi:hypothetical protein